MRNPYSILEIDEDANIEDIKKAYRKLAVKWHPDKNDGSNESHTKFILINWAYQILSNPENKRIYDKFGYIEGEESGLEEILSKFHEDLDSKTDDRKKENFMKAIKEGKKGYAQQECGDCNGAGVINKEIGFFIKAVKCKRCKGKGWIDYYDYDHNRPKTPSDYCEPKPEYDFWGFRRR